MFTNRVKEYYFKDGKLDFSILDEEIDNDSKDIMEELESIQTREVDVSATLEEVALMFDDEQIENAFSRERLEEEVKSFEKKD